MPASLKGQFLIATPSMGDKRFFETIIYMIDHNKDGAMGLVINIPMHDMQFSDVLKEMKLGKKEELINLSPDIQTRAVLAGGPVDKSRGFVLHSKDYMQKDNSFSINDEISMTATSDVLKAIAFGKPPKKSLFALGYCGWSAMQLENELKNNGWLITPFTSALLFNIPLEERYDFALAQIGATRASLSPTFGNA